MIGQAHRALIWAFTVFHVTVFNQSFEFWWIHLKACISNDWSEQFLFSSQPRLVWLVANVESDSLWLTIQGRVHRGKKLHLLNVNAFSTKVLIRDTSFTSPTDRHFTDVVIRATRRSSHLQCKRSTSFLSYFKTLSIGPVPGIEPTTFRSAVKRSTDWANPAGVTSSQ